MKTKPIDLAVIGGTGLADLENLEITHREVVHTPYGEPSGPITHGVLAGHHVIFVPRHGAAYSIPPHKVNYRANLWALRHLGAGQILAVNAVGGIRDDLSPGRLAVPDQIIDYTWGRCHTFFEDDLDRVVHVDFTLPYSQKLRGEIISAGKDADIDVADSGTYATSQGPRLESSAEVNAMAAAGADMVGMTGMPETALARELDLSYASCAVVSNWAAGRGEGPITMDDILQNLDRGMKDVRLLLEHLVTRL